MKISKYHRLTILCWLIIVTFFQLISGSNVSRAASIGIFTENAEAISTISTEYPSSLLQVAYATPRFMVENAQSISTLSLTPLIIEGDSQPQTSSSTRIMVENAVSISTLNIEPPSGLIPVTEAPSPTTTNQPVPTSPPSTAQVEQIALETGQPYVNLYGHRQEVVVGEEIILYLSVVNPITSLGTMSVQLTLEIPSGWSVTSSAFGHGAGGLRTNTYEIEQGPNLREIDVHVLANEQFEGNIVGYIDYYFNDSDEAPYNRLITLPVIATLEQTVIPAPPKSPGPISIEEWWQKPQWLIPIIILVIACLSGIVVFIKRRKAY